MASESLERSSTHSAIFSLLADFVCDLRLDMLPSSVLRRVDHVVMDLLGSTWISVGSRGSRALWSYARGENGASEATLWGTRVKAGVADAATVNGALAYEAEYDDGNSLGGHWGSSSIPAILALAQRDGATAEDVVLSIVAAYEVGNRVSRLFAKDLLERGIHFPGTMGAIAAIAGAGRVMRLRRDTLASALGHAALLPVSPYLPGHECVDTKSLYSGWANHLGIHATALAKAGYEGSPTLLEGRDGLAHALGWRGGKEGLTRPALDGLGQTWAIMKTYFKVYPCCRWLQAPVAGVLKLMREHALDPLDVETIRVGAPAFLAMYCADSEHAGGSQGKYSLAYCVGAAAARRTLGQREFESDALSDPSIVSMAGRVEFAVDPDLDAEFPWHFSTVVEMVTRDGRRLRSRDVPPWGPESPPDLEELATKFMPIMRSACGDAVANDWLAWFRKGFLADVQLSGFFELLDRSAIT